MGLDYSGFEMSLVAGCYEQGNEPLGYIKGEVNLFFYYLSDCHLKKSLCSTKLLT
jgi:hypothetical protein